MITFEPLWIEDYLDTAGIRVEPQLIVDCGCGKPMYNSNSRHFINQGWRALLIDGLQSNIDTSLTFYEGNKRVQGLRAILAGKPELVRFDEDTRHWSLTRAERCVWDDDNGQRTQRLSDILFEMDFMDVGILSLDIEGMEENVLRDLMDNHIYPQVIISEANDPENAQWQTDILRERYDLIGGILPNYFYLRK